jgi:hypothetical protein
MVLKDGGLSEARLGKFAPGLASFHFDLANHFLQVALFD